MGSILKRISPTSNFAPKSDRQLQKAAHIHFNLDEPDILISKKLGSISNSRKSSKHTLNSAINSNEVYANSELTFDANISKVSESNFLNNKK